MADFTESPRDKAIYDRNDPSFNDLIDVVDRIRQNMAFVDGSITQKDASVSDRVTVPNGTTLTVTVTPDSGFILYCSEVSVDPFLQNADYELAADGVSTDAASLSFGVPKTVRDKIQAVIENSTGASKDFVFTTDATSARDPSGGER